MTLQERYRKEYKEETGREDTESILGFTCYTDDYVEWLQFKLAYKEYER